MRSSPFIAKLRVFWAVVVVLIAALLVRAASRLLAPPLPVPGDSQPAAPQNRYLPLKDASAPGGPIGVKENGVNAAQPQYTNESLHALQEKEKKELGIR